VLLVHQLTIVGLNKEALMATTQQMQAINQQTKKAIEIKTNSNNYPLELKNCKRVLQQVNNYQ